MERIFLERTREEWREFASQHDCCLEPLLELDEALDSELVRAREMVVELEQPGHRRGQAARRAGQALADAGRPAGPGPGARRAHRARCSTALGYSGEEIEALQESEGAVGGPVAGAQGTLHAS